MPEFNYREIDRFLKSPDRYPVYLIFGEEVLCKSVFDSLLQVILPPAKRSLNYDVVDETEGGIFQAVERMCTFSLQPGPKVVALLDSKIFYSKQDQAHLLSKAKGAVEEDDFKKAAGFYLRLLSHLSLDLEDLKKPEGVRALNLGKAENTEWIEAINTHCIENRLSIPEDTDPGAVLQKAIEKGFPKGNHLVITADLVDRRKSLYKTIQKNGMIIDCSVPRGDRREDRLAQEAVLNEKAKEILSGSGKTIDADALGAVIEMTGFDFRTFCQNLEILIDFVGDDPGITKDAVEAVLQRTRKDPMYEMTNAVADRDLRHALSVLGSLLSDDAHPLQILAAVANQVRRLLQARGFLESDQSRSWHPAMSFPQFRSVVLPEIQTYDQSLLDQIARWEEMLGVDERASGKKKKPGSSTDLLVARYPQNPYPIYQTLRRAESYTTAELLEAIIRLSEADVRLKTTGQNPKHVMEATLIEICGRTE